MQSDERDGFEFGIQMLAPGAVAVSIEAGASTGAKLEAVLLPELPALKKAPALLAPRGVFKERGEFLFSAGGAQEPVKVLATRLLTQTASYEIFEFIRF